MVSWEDILLIKRIIETHQTIENTINEDKIIEISKFAVDYAKYRTGLDWQNKPSIISGFRAQLRRNFMKILKDKSLINTVVEEIVNYSTKNFLYEK